jgi:hypothetical protein
MIVYGNFWVLDYLIVIDLTAIVYLIAKNHG